MFRKALLVIPPFYRLMGARNNWLNLGLSYIAGVLEGAGTKVKVYNADYVDGGWDIDQEECFENYEMYSRRVNDSGDPIWKEVIGRIIEYDPDLVGITLVVSATVKAAVRIAEEVKRWKPEIRIVVGGAHATILPEETLAVKEFDYVVRGEGERTMFQLVRGRYRGAIDGLSYRENGGVVHNRERAFIERLDYLPFPRKEQYLVPIKDLRNEFGVISTSRGCPYRCGFCASHKIWNRRVRYRSVDNVIAELKFRKNEYGVESFYFSDDSFNLNLKRGKELCRRIIGARLGIKYYCEMNVKPLDDELLGLMKESGCIRLKFGVESGSDRILKLMRKNATAEDNRKACRMAREQGIPFSIYTMIGYATETKEEIEETYQLAKSCGANYTAVTVATPQTGTDLGEMAEKMGVGIPKEKWESYYHQAMTSALNENVNEEVIRKFLALNKKFVDIPPYEMRLRGREDGRADKTA